MTQAVRLLCGWPRPELPVDPLPMLRAIPGVMVLEWDAAQRYFAARGAGV